MSEQRTIFITGGAGGMGLATGKLFASHGWFVGLFDHNEALLNEVTADWETSDVMAMRLDVTDAIAFEQAVAAFGEKTGGRMDILFNNAGIAPGGLFEDMSLATMEQIIAVNVMGVIYGTRAALPLLKTTDNPLVVNTSSSVATFGHPMRAVYTASKFAVKGLTEALSLEFEQYGIRTADILPGCIDTPMLRREIARGRKFDPAMLESLPKEGAYRLMPVSAIAEAVWSAWQDSSRIHFYVPEEVGDTDRVKGHDIAAAQEEIREFIYGRR